MADPCRSAAVRVIEQAVRDAATGHFIVPENTLLALAQSLETKPHSHLLTLHANNERSRLWVTCSCGWVGNGHFIPCDSDAKHIAADAAAEGRAHLETHD
jgi:hypothetical protein